MVSTEKSEGTTLPVPDPKLEPVAYEPHGPHGLVGPVEPNYAQKDHVRGLRRRIAPSTMLSRMDFSYSISGASA